MGKIIELAERLKMRKGAPFEPLGPLWKRLEKVGAALAAFPPEGMVEISSVTPLLTELTDILTATLGGGHRREELILKFLNSQGKVRAALYSLHFGEIVRAQDLLRESLMMLCTEKKEVKRDENPRL